MNADLQIVEAKANFRKKVKRLSEKKLGRKKIKEGAKVTYGVITRLIKEGYVRRSTLEKVVKNIEGETAIVDDFINS